MNYFKIIIELKGHTITGIRENTSDPDQAFLLYKKHAEEHYGTRLLHFDCVQLSNHSHEVKQYLKEKGRTGKTLYQPEDQPDTMLPLDEKVVPPAKNLTAHGGGRYRNHKADQKGIDERGTMGDRKKK